MGSNNRLTLTGHRFDFGPACHLAIPALAGLCHLHATGYGANGFAHITNVSHKMV